MQCTFRRVQCKTISGLQYKTLCLGQSYTSPRTIKTCKRNLKLNSELNLEHIFTHKTWKVRKMTNDFMI